MEIIIAAIVVTLGLVVVAGMYFFKKDKGGGEDSGHLVRRPEDFQEPHARQSAAQKASTTVKTAQLAQLKERLADAQQKSPGTPGTKKIQPAGRQAIKPVEAPAAQPAAKQPDAAPDFTKTMILPRKDVQAALAAGAPSQGTQPAQTAGDPAKSDEADAPWSPESAGFANPLAEFIATTSSEKKAKVDALPGDRLVEAAPVAPAAHAVAVPAVEAAPIPAPVAASTGDDGASKDQEAAPPQEEKIHVLLVDDSKVVRVKTEKLLLSRGFSVTTAVDGLDALARLEAIKPNLIITDIEMPNLDGFGLVRNIRNNLRTADIPIIVMTSHVNLHLDIAATEGINGFLPKPFNEQDLVDQVTFLTSQ